MGILKIKVNLSDWIEAVDIGNAENCVAERNMGSS